MKRFLRGAIAAAALLPMIAAANEQDFTENFELLPSSMGTVNGNFDGAHFYLANVNDVSTAQARVRRYRMPQNSSNYFIDTIILNRDNAYCGADVRTATFPTSSVGATTVVMSGNGRYIVQSTDGNTAQRYEASVDCGQTYLPVVLPGVGTHTTIAIRSSNSIRAHNESSNGHMLYDHAGNDVFIAYNAYDPTDSNDATNTKLLLTRMSMPLKNMTTYDLGAVRCSSNGSGTAGSGSGGQVRMVMNDNRQIFIHTDCGQTFIPTSTGSPIDNIPEVIIFNAANGTVQQRMSIGGLSSNLQTTRNGLVRAVATNGADFYTLSDAGTASALSRIKRWSESSPGAGDFMVSNSLPSNTPFANISTTAANPYPDLMPIAAIDPLIAQFGAEIRGFDGVRTGVSGTDSVDFVWRASATAPLFEFKQDARKSRIASVSTAPVVTTTLISDYSQYIIESFSFNTMGSTIQFGNYFTFLGGGGLFAQQVRIFAPGANPIYPFGFTAGFEAYDIS